MGSYSLKEADGDLVCDHKAWIEEHWSHEIIIGDDGFNRGPEIMEWCIPYPRPVGPKDPDGKREPGMLGQKECWSAAIVHRRAKVETPFSMITGRH